MNIFRLAIRNTRRHPRRAVLSGLAIGIAVAAVTFMDSYIRGILEGMFETYIRLDAGHVKIIPGKGVDRTRPLPLSDGISGVGELQRIIGDLPGVTSVSPRIRFPVLLDKPGGSTPAIGTATQPSAETMLINLEGMISKGRVPRDDSWEAAIGSQLAEEIELGIGDELFMVTADSYGGMGPGLYEIVGIVQTGVGTFDRKQFFVPLQAAQEQLSMDDSAMEIVCRIEDGMDAAVLAAERINQELARLDRSDLQAIPWQKQGMLYSMFAPARFYNFIVMALLGIVALTAIINTVLMSVLERTREIGALRALGFSRREVIKMIVSESLSIGLIATLGGVTFGLAVALILQHTGIDLSAALQSTDFPLKPIVHPHPSLLIAIKAGIYGLIVSLIAAWYPAKVAVRLQPATALRRS